MKLNLTEIEKWGQSAAGVDNSSARQLHSHHDTSRMIIPASGSTTVAPRQRAISGSGTSGRRSMSDIMVPNENANIADASDVAWRKLVAETVAD